MSGDDDEGPILDRARARPIHLSAAPMMTNGVFVVALALVAACAGPGTRDGL
jgi:hypothetical protein